MQSVPEICLFRSSVRFAWPAVLAKLQTAGHFVNWQTVIWPKATKSEQFLKNIWFDVCCDLLPFHPLSIIFLVSLKVIVIAPNRFNLLLLAKSLTGHWSHLLWPFDNYDYNLGVKSRNGDIFNDYEPVDEVWASALATFHRSSADFVAQSALSLRP